MSKPLIILGGGGHAEVLLELINELSLAVLGFTDVQDSETPPLLSGLNFLGNDDVIFSSHTPDEVRLINGLGSVGAINRRAAVFGEFAAKNYRFNTLVHPTAYLSPSVSYGQGLQVLAGAVINTSAQLGDNVLINCRALIEHHCSIGNHTHIASGAVLCGACQIGQSVHIGAGAVINQGINIGDGAIIASGAVVIADVAAGSLMAGVPAQQKR